MHPHGDIRRKGSKLQAAIRDAVRTTLLSEAEKGSPAHEIHVCWIGPVNERTRSDSCTKQGGHIMEDGNSSVMLDRKPAVRHGQVDAPCYPLKLQECAEAIGITPEVLEHRIGISDIKRVRGKRKAFTRPNRCVVHIRKRGTNRGAIADSGTGELRLMRIIPLENVRFLSHVFGNAEVENGVAWARVHYAIEMGEHMTTGMDGQSVCGRHLHAMRVMDAIGRAIAGLGHRSGNGELPEGVMPTKYNWWIHQS